jgi:HB1, ASXL, restriction endonuclease HTH domain
MAASKIHQNGKPKKTRKKSTETKGKGKKLSALDAAAQVLAETGQPMSCKEMIEAMAQKGYWSSPGGKTPVSTLYSGILKEITTKGKESRFKKTDRGRFARA